MGKLKLGLLTGAAVFALASPGYAADSAITIWNTANPVGAETAIGTGQASVLGSNLNGITVSVSTVQKGTNPNDLTEANISIANTDSTAQTLKIIAGANGYAGPSDLFKLTGAIGATLGGSDLIGQFFVDPLNTLNGETLSVVGTQIGTFDSGALVGPESFSFNGLGSLAVNTPYGLAEELTLTLAPGATVFIQGMSMDATSAVPEPSTWAMMVAGFVILGFFGWSKKRTTRFAV
jgi:PEP-CTERM motif